MPHTAPAPVGLYEHFACHEGMVFLSAISSSEEGELITGKVGIDVDLERGRTAAQRAARNLLAVLLDAAGGDSDRIVRVLMVRGHVNASNDFALVHKVIDAASELIVAELGDKGEHARTAIGCATLPNLNTVTLEAIAIVALGPK